VAARHILYVSGSIGLGHIARDLAVAAELRRMDPSLEISWLAGGPARDELERVGETLLPEARSYESDTAVAEAVATGYGANLARYLVRARGAWRRNADTFARVIARTQFDMVVTDEAYELSVFLAKDPQRLRCPYAILVDFFGVDAVSGGLRERLVAQYFNRVWVRCDRKLLGDGTNLCLFVGEPQDIPVGRLGWRLPDRRRHTERYWRFVGYMIGFDPAVYADAASLRTELGYDERPLIIAAVGGTAIGGDLLGLCAASFPLVRRRVPTARLVLVCGPRVSPDSLGTAEGVEVRGFVPDLHEHFAACDLAVVQAGGTSTLELTALRRPFLYFPLEGHFEQQDVARRQARLGAGVCMTFSQTTPESLADAIVENLGVSAHYPVPPVAGARAAAELILSLVDQ
jgi:predicted glycosyltransferase